MVYDEEVRALKVMLAEFLPDGGAVVRVRRAASS